MSQPEPPAQHLVDFQFLYGPASEHIAIPLADLQPLTIPAQEPGLPAYGQGIYYADVLYQGHVYVEPGFIDGAAHHHEYAPPIYDIGGNFLVTLNAQYDHGLFG